MADQEVDPFFYIFNIPIHILPSDKRYVEVIVLDTYHSWEAVLDVAPKNYKVA